MSKFHVKIELKASFIVGKINLSLALLETNSKGVRDHIDYVKRAILVLPEIEKELKESLEDGLSRKPNWKTLLKVKSWLDI